MYRTFLCDIMSRMILSTQNSSTIVLEDSLLSMKQSHATNNKVDQGFVGRDSVSLCEYFVTLRRQCDPLKCRNNQQ